VKIDPEHRTVHLSVRELSDFSVWKRSVSRSAGPWRTHAGRVWHETLQRELEKEFDREVQVSGTLRCGGWNLFVEGRCDLRSRAEGTPAVWGEIKTVETALPLPDSELRARYPAYFRQAATYGLLSDPAQEPSARAFLLFLDIETGIRQRIEIEKDDRAHLHRHIENLVGFLDSLVERIRLRQKLLWNPYRENPREGQVEASQLLSETIRRSRTLGFEAPTGFGKTRILLERALEELRNGGADRILYLTGKVSGQEQACAELKTLFRGHPPLRSYRMRNRPEHVAVCAVEDCSARQCGGMEARGGVQTPLSVLDHPGSPESAWERVCDTTSGYRHCAYDLSRAFLAFSDLWIADYNYLFHPSSRPIFLEQPDFDPARTWVLIDEAHNLVDRVAGALGGSLTTRALFLALEDLRSRGGQRKIPGILKDLADLIGNAEPKAIIRTETVYLLLDHFESLQESLETTPVPWRDLEPGTFQTLRSAEAVNFLFSRDTLDPVFWSPAPGRLEWLPLDPSPWMSECLRGFSQTLFFSATLEPLPALPHLEETGDATPPVVRIRPRLADRFHIAIDTRVETTLKSRKSYYRQTASTAASFAEHSSGCVAVFFSSYEYAEAIETYLAAEAPHLRICLQPRELNALEKELFARTAPSSNDLLLLMLGGTFAEAIDHFGGTIRNAMIVGPGLPELNAINRLRIDRYPNREEGFHQVCRVPGIRRVNQAIGRFVRSESHTANILLHDRRFLEAEYFSLLREDLGEARILKTNRDWAEWSGSIDRPDP